METLCSHKLCWWDDIMNKQWDSLKLHPEDTHTFNCLLQDVYISESMLHMTTQNDRHMRHVSCIYFIYF